MASIRNSISLQDRMSPVFRSIIKSMDSTLRVMRNLDTQANKGVQSKAYRAAERDIKRANNELLKMKNNLDRADRSANNLASSTNRVANNMGRMRSGGFNLSNLAAGLYLLRNIANLFSSMMSVPDDMLAVQYRLATYDTTDATGEQLFDESYKAAQNSRSDIGTTANLASRILVSGATNGSGAEAIGLAETLNKASFLGGSSSQESQRALLQLSQGLASGALQGDELRAIREQAPGLTDVLAKGLSSLGEKGVLPEKFIGTTMGDLKQLGADGELTAQRVIAAFKEMDEYVDTAFADSPKQFGQAITGIGNVWKRWMKIMSSGENAFAKINQGAWKLLEWFESDSGTKFFETLSKGINLTVDLIIMFIDWIGEMISAFQDMEESSNILQSALLTLGIVAISTGVAMAAAWIMANWQILLVIAAIGLVIYGLMALGVSASQIVGGICGAFLFLWNLLVTIIVWIVNIVYWAISIVWNICVALALIIIDAIIMICTIVISIVQIIVQIILWACTTIWGVIVTIYNVIYTVFKTAVAVVKGFVVGVAKMFAGMANAVLGVLKTIASGIDWVFGSNLADTIGGWMKGIDGKVVELETKLDPMGEFEDIGNQWSDSYSDLGDMFAGNGQYDDWNIMDNMGDLWSNSTSQMGDLYGAAGDIMLDPTMLNGWAADNSLNPMDGWNKGYEFGTGIADMIGDVDLGMSDLSGISSMMDSGLELGGGDLDSVGTIKSDVEISDEDVKLLRDITARDFLLNLQTVTPTANIKFGDVRETADVNKIMEVIQDMVDEELATSLVVE